MKKVPYSQIDKGTFLVSTPEIDTGLFFRSVILICEHAEEGSFGLVINKDLDIALPEDIMESDKIQNPSVGIRASGPVQTNQMMLLHTSKDLPGQTLEVCPEVFLGGDLTFLQEKLTDKNGPNMYLCFGYAGWGRGQLEREFMDGSWLLYPASKELIFDIPADRLWQEILRRMGGKFATLSMIPEDLTLN